ncbi:NADPH:quinone oxidoreductase family protein [Aquibaculum sediminis]|uniref:NADPH:quinone oxidoreductase family protein n=1 Tax=Aquibaculum sediminis TaxID=3231907 RepID=UPI0034550281
MRALLCRAWGEPEDLELDEIAAPEPGPGEIAIAVEAAGVNFADTLIIRGKYQEKPPFPFAPGLEVAGTVAALGEGVDTFRIGDPVMGIPGHGGYAEVAVAKASDVFHRPAGFDAAIAAGFPITYGTAHGALVWRAGLQAGETLLVHGAAGGTGLAAVEVGKALGATVIATAGSADKLAIAQEHGADHLIDYREEDLRARVKEITGGRGADVVFDPVGGKVFDASLRCTAWEGRLVVIGFAAGEVQQIPANLLLVKNLAAFGFYWGSYRKNAPERVRTQFEQLAAWAAEGKLKPHVSHRLPLARGAEALRLLEQRVATGKVVLEVSR